MSIEERYQDVLQNIESAVIRCYRAHPELTDFAVLQAYGALIDLYRAQQNDRQPRPANLNALQEEVFEAAKEMCDWRLGGTKLGGDSEPPPETIDAGILVSCLRKLHKSVQKWTKRQGRQGYLNFVSDYV